MCTIYLLKDFRFGNDDSIVRTLKDIYNRSTSNNDNNTPGFQYKASFSDVKLRFND